MDVGRTTTYELRFFPSITDEDIRRSVKSLLFECKDEFVPPLSDRRSPGQSEFGPNHENSGIPVEYFAELIQQCFVLAVHDSSLLAFMSFRSNYYSDDLIEYQPSNYVTTVCVKKGARRLGICSAMYDFMFRELPPHFRMPFTTTRTWSSNKDHIRILTDKKAFSVAKVIQDHRGAGIHTIYFGKRL